MQMSFPVRLAAVTALFLLGAASIPGALAADATCEPQSIAKKYPGIAGKTLKIGISAADKPNSYRDDKDPSVITGFDAEYARAAFACAGAPIEFSVGGWGGLLPALVAGQTDMMWDALYYTPERAKSVDYVLYTSARSAIVAVKGNPKNIHGFEDLCGVKAVTQVVSIEIVSLQHQNQACKDAHKPEIDIAFAQDRPSALRELQNGREDVYLGIGSGVTYDPDAFEVVHLFNSGLKVGVGVHKGNTELENALRDAIAALQANGTTKTLYERFGLNPELSVPAEIVVQ